MEAIWLRALIVYPVVIVLLRFIGRSLNFQSRPYDMAVLVLIGSSAANLIVNREVEIWRAFTGLTLLALVHTLLSFASIWNPLKPYLVGQPATLIENGQFLKSALIQYQLSVEEVLAALREKGYHKVADVEFAMLEASGKLSVVPKSQARPVTPRDLGLSTQYEGFTTTLISDGVVMADNLGKVNLDETWLLRELLHRGAAGPEDVLFASLDTKGELFVIRQQDVPFLQAIFKGVQAQGETKAGLPPRVSERL